ncbi:hypothetical protein BOTBODRAFT_35913 [Botryobasidium botryosum FD-172 SS1]|uniref:Uncharacterized protein n=1 Tax=Botryobasidium botryosum (strain FD-172 SS1) TaxID=930990 RepID=A0A067MGW3_BOTB1|nr:hypothetical protein BOTBODRAFT_35913 [Botryobasidium botryosum FD-172 SS1]
MVGLVSTPEQLVEAKRFIDSTKARALSMRKSYSFRTTYPYRKGPAHEIEDVEKVDYDATFAGVAGSVHIASSSWGKI